MEAHGVSVVESQRAHGRRLELQSGVHTQPPHHAADGDAVERPGARQRADAHRLFAGRHAGRGTINNCANGYHALGHQPHLRGELGRLFPPPAATDNPRRSAKEVAGLARYGVTSSTGNYGWSSSVRPTNPAPSTAAGTRTVDPNASGPAGDFRNEPNQFGWVVEVDPYDAVARRRASAPRSAAWAMKAPGRPFVAGRRPAFYMGDDAAANISTSSCRPRPGPPPTRRRGPARDRRQISRQRHALRRQVQRRRKGSWLPLVFGQAPLTHRPMPPSPFQDQADVLIHTRLAADAVGATPMDRPEWTAVNPDARARCTSR
jgi:secreted PhoX family phosphatase